MNINPELMLEIGDKTISLQEIFDKLDFDFESGKVYWKNPHYTRIALKGKEAGRVCGPTTGGKYYWAIKINQKNIKRSRLIYAASHGRNPAKYIDHINGDTLDDRISNLREADAAQNMWNRNTPAGRKHDLPQGVSKSSPTGDQYIARIKCRNKLYRLGCYETPELASAAYQKAKKELHGEFSKCVSAQTGIELYEPTGSGGG